MAIELDGSASTADIAANSDIPTVAPISFSCWVYLDDVDSTTAQVFRAGTDTTTGGWGVFHINAALHFLTDGVKDYVSTMTLVEGVWTHIACVLGTDFDVDFYQDGVFTDEDLHTADGTANTDDPWSIGCHINTVGTRVEFFDGKIEDLRIWDVAITAEQIAILAAGSREPIGGEVGWWSCEDYEGLAHPDGTTLTGGTHFLADKSVNDNRADPLSSPVARASDAPRYQSWSIWTSTALITQAMVGAITNTGALVMQTGKPVVGSITNTGALLVQSAKFLVGSITNTGVLIVEAQKVLVGAITNTGALAKEIQKVIAGSITNTGALLTQFRKTIYMLLDVEIAVDMQADTSLVNEDE